MLTLPSEVKFSEILNIKDLLEKIKSVGTTFYYIMISVSSLLSSSCIIFVILIISVIIFKERKR